jgi:DNA repair protein RadC
MRVRELEIRYRTRPESFALDAGKPLNYPRDAVEFFRRVLEHEPVEVMGLLCVSTKLHVLCYHEVSRGDLSSAPAHPREIFKAAILANAAGIVLAHCHPSGDPTPSLEDRVLTKRLYECAQILQIDFLDHLVIGHDGRYYSFREMTQL